MKTYSLCLVLLFAAVANAAVHDRPDNNVNEVQNNFQEDAHLMENEANMNILNIIEEEELLGNYDDYYDDDHYDEDYDEDDKDQDLASGDNYDDEDAEWLDDNEEEDDITDYDDKDEERLDDYEEEDDITFDDDKDEEWLDDYEEEDDITFDDDKDDILYKYHTEDYEGTGYYDFFKEIEDVAYQPPQVQIRDHGKPDKEDETVTVAEPSSRNLLVSSLLFPSGLASFALFTLAFIMYFCIRRRRDSTSAKQAQLPFVIQHGSGSSPLHSSIIKPGKYQPVATQENRSNHGIENDNSLLKQQTQLEEKLLPWPVKQCIITNEWNIAVILIHNSHTFQNLSQFLFFLKKILSQWDLFSARFCFSWNENLPSISQPSDDCATAQETKQIFWNH